MIARLLTLWKSIARWQPVILLAAIGLVIYAYWHTPSYEKFYSQGLKYLVLKQYDRAGTEFMKAISEGQEDGGEAARARMRDAYLLAGEINDLHLGRYARAVELYHEASVAFAHDTLSLIALKRSSEIFRDKLGNAKKAIETDKEIIREFPQTPEAVAAKLRIVKTLLDARDYEQAVVEGQAFLARPPKGSEAHLFMLLGDALASLERYEDAAGMYGRIVGEFPKSDYAKLARFEYGNCLVRLGRLEEALKVFTQVLETYPNPDVVRLRIAETHSRIERAKHPKLDSDVSWLDAKGFKRSGQRQKDAGKNYRTDQAKPALEQPPIGAFSE